MTDTLKDSRATEIDANLQNDKMQRAREDMMSMVAEREAQVVEQRQQEQVAAEQPTSIVEQGQDPLRGNIDLGVKSKTADEVPDEIDSADRPSFDASTSRLSKFVMDTPGWQFSAGTLDGVSQLLNAGQDVVEGLFGVDSKGKLGNLVLDISPGNENHPMIRALGAFFAPYKIVAKATQAFGVARKSKKLKLAIDGALADFTAFDPNDGNLAAVIAENSKLAAPVAELLANGKDTPAIRGRINNVLEGYMTAKGINKFISAVKFYGLRKKVNPYRKWRAEQKFDEQPDIEFPNAAGPKKKQIKTTGFVRDINEQFGINWGKIDSDRDIKRIIATLRKQDEESLSKILQDTSRKDLKAHAQKEVAENAEGSVDKILELADASDLRLSRKDQMIARVLSVSSAKYVQNISDMVLSGAIPEQEMDRAFLLFTKLQRAKSLFQADSSRRFSDLQEKIGASEKATQEFTENLSVDLAKSVEESGLPVQGIKLAERIAVLPNQAAREKFFDDLAGPGGLRMFQEIWLNALLTGPKTHFTNLTSNTLANLNEFTLEKFLTASIDTLRRAPNDEKAFFGEIPAAFFGMRETMGESFRLAKAVWKERKHGLGINEEKFAELGGLDNVKLEGFAKPEATVENLNRMARRFQRQIGVPEGEFMELNEENFFAHMLDASFQLWRNLGGAALVSSDAFFKSMAYRMQINSAAYRAGKAKNLKGAELTNFIVEQRQKPDELIRMEAQDMAAYLTFTKALGKRGKAVQGLVEANPELRFVLPFVRTPMNLNKYAFERFPGLNMAVGESSQALFPHGMNLSEQALTKEQRMARSRAVARLAQGSMLAGLAYNIAENQLNNPNEASVAVTGSGPVGGNAKGSRDVLKAARVQNDSIAFRSDDGKWHQWSFDRNDPYGMVFGMAVDLHAFRQDLDDHSWGEASQAFSLALSRQMLSKTWATNFRNLMDAMLAPERNTGKYWKSLFGSVVPRIIAEGATFVDPTLRETQTLFDEIKQNLPVLRETLEPKLDVLARPRSKQRNNLLDAIFPTERQTKDETPLVQEMLNIGLNFNTIGDSLSTEGVSIKLTRRQKNWLIRQTVERAMLPDPEDNGKPKNFTDMMSDIIKRDSYKFAGIGTMKKKQTSYEKSQRWQSTYNDFRDAVINGLPFRNEFPALKARLEELKEEKSIRETGQSQSAFGGFSGTLLPR